jgi:hypothetical protein
VREYRPAQTPNPFPSYAFSLTRLG